MSNKSKTKLADNTLVNALTKESIDAAVNTWFTRYKTSRLKSTASSKDKLAYIVEVDGVLWLNPLAFSMTKGTDGYCTAPFKVEEMEKARIWQDKVNKDWKLGTTNTSSLCLVEILQ